MQCSTCKMFGCSRLKGICRLNRVQAYRLIGPKAPWAGGLVDFLSCILWEVHLPTSSSGCSCRDLADARGSAATPAASSGGAAKAKCLAVLFDTENVCKHNFIGKCEESYRAWVCCFVKLLLMCILGFFNWTKALPKFINKKHKK